MKIALCICLILSQAACVSTYFPAPDRPAPRYSGDFQTHQFFNERQAANAEKWAEWNKNYVSDDVLLIEIVDQNGQTRTVGKAK